MPRTDLVTDVVKAVAAADGREPDALPSLFDYIDPEILSRLDKQEKQGACRFTFQYAGHRVTVTQDSEIVVDGESHSTDNIVR
jgi:hypothetical protein